MASPLRSASQNLTTRARTRAVASAGRIAVVARTARRFLLSLALLLALLAFMAAAPIRSLDAANQEVEYLEATRQQLTASVDDLEQQRARLKDPDEVELLARTRFGMVRPGETAFVVMTPEDEVRAEAEPEQGSGHRAWYRWLFDAVADMLPG